jgi:hypothetical protein
VSVVWCSVMLRQRNDRVCCVRLGNAVCGRDEQTLWCFQKGFTNVLQECYKDSVRERDEPVKPTRNIVAMHLRVIVMRCEVCAIVVAVGSYFYLYLGISPILSGSFKSPSSVYVLPLPVCPRIL